MSVDIKGLLNWPKKRLAGVITKDDGQPASAQEARDFLQEELLKGRRVLPMGDCDNFDYITGCKGHPAE